MFVTRFTMQMHFLTDKCKGLIKHACYDPIILCNLIPYASRPVWHKSIKGKRKKCMIIFYFSDTKAELPLLRSVYNILITRDIESFRPTDLRPRLLETMVSYRELFYVISLSETVQQPTDLPLTISSLNNLKTLLNVFLIQCLYFI